MRRNTVVVSMLFFIIFVTGATGLIYEVAWQKYLGRLIGSDSIATAIILAAFLGGLSFGYYLCGKFSISIKNHFKAYAIMEGMIGVWCLFFPKIYNFVESLSATWSFSAPFLILVQGFFCSILLMGVPTICMGSTIPFLTRGLSTSIANSTKIHARVYAINTTGAFIGTLLAGFFLIPLYGLPLTIMGAAAINLTAFLSIYLLQQWIQIEKTKAVEDEDILSSGPRSGDLSKTRLSPISLYFIAFLSGFYVMTLENAIIRLTNFSFGSSSYSFSLIISVFILSIAIGSYFIGQKKTMRRETLYVNQLLITISLFIVYLSIDWWPYFAHLIRVSFQSNIVGFWSYYFFSFLALLTVLIVPISLMGATVPITFHEIKRDLENVGRYSGYLFSFNTIGNLTGSLIGGVVFYYFLNNNRVFLVALFLAAISTLLASRVLDSRHKRYSWSICIAALILLIVSPFYNQNHFMSGTFRVIILAPYSLDGPQQFFEVFGEGQKLEFFKDGPTTTVGVVDIAGADTTKKQLAIMVNGKSDSSTQGDIYTTKLAAHLPALFAEKLETAMVIGIGTGITVGELTLYPEITKIDVAEISPYVAKALPLFGDYTYQVHKNPKVHVQIGDAFRIMKRNKDKWDLIISEPSNPWVTGVDLLFTQEFYQIAKAHLNPGGIFLQWIHTYASDQKMVGMIMNTLRSVFPYFHVFVSGPGDLQIIASEKKLRKEDVFRAKERLFSHSKVLESLQEINLDSLESILLRELWPSEYIGPRVSKDGLQTFDNPRLHYMAGRSFFFNSALDFSALYPYEVAEKYPYFLLTKLYDDWTVFPFSKQEFSALLTSSKDINSNIVFPTAKFLRIKAYLSDPIDYPIDDALKQEIGAKYLPFIINNLAEVEWQSIGIMDKSIKERSKILIRQIKNNRNWINPYPIDGLLTLLRTGMKNGKDAYEKNWCALSYILLKLPEDDEKSEVNMVFQKLIKNSDGQVLLPDNEKQLFDFAKNRIDENK